MFMSLCQDRYQHLGIVSGVSRGSIAGMMTPQVHVPTVSGQSGFLYFSGTVTENESFCVAFQRGPHVGAGGSSSRDFHGLSSSQPGQRGGASAGGGSGGGGGGGGGVNGSGGDREGPGGEGGGRVLTPKNVQASWLGA